MQRDTMKINLFKLHPTIFKIRHLLFHDSLNLQSSKKSNIHLSILFSNSHDYQKTSRRLINSSYHERGRNWTTSYVKRRLDALIDPCIPSDNFRSLKKKKIHRTKNRE